MGARPLAIVAGDFNEDGQVDLVTGHDAADRSFLAFHAGQAIITRDGTVQEEAPFLPSSLLAYAGPPPDHLAALDFDADSHLDLVIASTGSSRVFFLPGDGRGGFSSPQAIDVGAPVSALAASNLEPQDSLMALLVATEEPGWPELLVLTSGPPNLRALGRSIPLPFVVRSMSVERSIPGGEDEMLIEGDEAIMSTSLASLSRGSPYGRVGQTIEDVAVNPGSRAVRARLSPDLHRDLVVLDSTGRSLRIDGPAWGRLRFALPGTPVAVVPLRLGVDALDDLVILTDAPPALLIVSTAPLATYGVTTDADSGPGSLRQAILDANASGGLDQIVFDLSGAAPFLIGPTASLPHITDAVVIDATTQPGFGGQPVVRIDGARAGVGTDGLTILGGGSTVRGFAISGFGGTEPGNGIILRSGGGNFIEGNLIGLDVSGVAAAPNSGEGILIESSANNVIGGPLSSSRNVISGNTGHGVVVTGTSSGGNRLQGNYIGTAISGIAPIANVAGGILIDDAPSTTVGGSTVARNVVSGNGAEGLTIAGAGASGNLVQGNAIGPDAGGNLLGNALQGIVLSASGNTIGGSIVSQRNSIAGNGGAGVAVVSGSGNRIARNSIHSNGALGIDLAGDGVTANDPSDGDSGPNSLQNYPVIFSVITDTTSSTIIGTLDSTPSASFVLEFFSNTGCDASGNGEGGQYFVSTTLTTDGTGQATFSLPLMVPLPAGSYLTATATNTAGDTSEFSACHRVSDLTPDEVLDVSWAGDTRLDWTAVLNADQYEIHRGTAALLPNLLDSASESCVRLTTVATTSSETLLEIPPGGSFYWYLLDGTNTHGRGSVGDATGGMRSLDSFGDCPSCSHDKCETGAPLSIGCDPCVDAVCSTRSSCCGSGWDAQCVDMVLSVCDSLACPSSWGSCSHSPCSSGEPLTAGCDSPPVSPSCTASVCTSDPVCCTTVWDGLCVGMIAPDCGLACN